MAKNAKTKPSVASSPRNLTSVSTTKAAGLAAILTALVYAGAYLLKGFDTIPIYVLLYERGFVQFFSTYGFCLAMAVLLMKRSRITTQNHAFAEVEQKVFAPVVRESAVTTSVAAQIQRKLQELPDEVRRSMLVTRLENSCRRLLNIQSAAEVDNIFQMLSEGDQALIESSYTVVRFLFALIPLLGFIGNVLGVGGGIGRFSEVLDQAQSFDAVRPALKMAALSLANAFDTTFLALLYSGLILAANAILLQREENLLAAVDEYCLERLVSRIKLTSSDISDVKQHATNLFSDLIGSIEAGNALVSERLQELVNKAEGRDGADTTKHLEALGNKLDIGTDKLVSQITGLAKKLGDGNSLIVTTLADKLAFVGARIDAVGEQVGGEAGNANAVHEIKSTVLSIAQLLEDHIGGLNEKLGEIAAQQAAPNQHFGDLTKALDNISSKFAALDKAADAFGLVSEMSGMFGQLQTTLDSLRPAIDSMSAEMAKEVNHILSQLLRVMIVGQRLAQPNEQDSRALNDGELLRRIFTVGAGR